MATLILVRHGQSIYNFENRFTGSVDIGLTQLGEQQAREAGEKLKGYTFHIAYTSMLVRAQESLRIILDVIGESDTPIVKDAALNERMYGSLQGLNKDETAAKYGLEQVELWRRSYDICPPDGESLATTYNRVVPYYKAEIEPKLKDGQDILVVAHGNSLRALMMYLEHISPAGIALVDILTGQPRMYVMDGDLKVSEVKYL